MQIAVEQNVEAVESASVTAEASESQNGNEPRIVSTAAAIEAVVMVPSHHLQ